MPSVYVLYCRITNYHKFSCLKQIHSIFEFLWVRILGTGELGPLCSGSQKPAIKVLAELHPHLALNKE